MQKSTLRKVIQSVIIVVVLIAGLFFARLIVSIINWGIPLTSDQIDMMVYLLYIGWLFSITYWCAP